MKNMSLMSVKAQSRSEAIASIRGQQMYTISKTETRKNI